MQTGRYLYHAQQVQQHLQLKISIYIQKAEFVNASCVVMNYNARLHPYATATSIAYHCC